MKLKYNTLITNAFGMAFEFVSKMENEEKINIETLQRMIDMNVSRAPEDQFSIIFSKNQSKNDYIPLFKLKVFHMWMDLICDFERFEFENDEEIVALNSLRYISQKLLYSYMFDTYDREWKGTTSPLWYSSCIKLFLEASSAWTKVDNEFVSNSIKWLDSPKALKMWEDYSSFSHKKNKDPFIQGDLWVISKVWDDLIFITEKIIPKIYDSIEKYLKNSVILKYFKTFRGWTEIIKNDNKRPKIINFRILDDTSNVTKLNLKNMQWTSFFDYNKATGFSNSTFIRAFNHINPISKKTKQKLATYSHKELYANLNLLKYRKDGSTFETLDKKESNYLIRNRVIQISNYIHENIIKVSLEELQM